MTTASKITMARIALIPFFIAAALTAFPGHEYAALAIFVLASLTDSLDGYIARRYNQVSTFGKFADPLADKLLVAAALLIFVERGQMPSWACMVVIAREFAVTGLRLAAMEDNIVIAAGTSGKIKTALSIVLSCVMLLPEKIQACVPLPWPTVDALCSAGIVLVTVYSGIDYFIANRRVLNTGD
ncbi:MAG: CDP-diacylglycerol--glycerol-3-phosphate 3-phosphatidyltransferase [Oscillospiraceae bacterium]|jgi:CDP-diacylglycerol--glycerol-3-phosphate 3-phosphatidyltransferase|nr:CDP-diacylglycerol--glycerol-3-phosphate 3-phosphatidyltransferase [Oscillospiraceae bacterium]